MEIGENVNAIFINCNNVNIVVGSGAWLSISSVIKIERNATL